MILFFDAPNNKQFYFQDSVTLNLERIIDLHNEIFVFLTFIFLFVCWMLIRSAFLFRESNSQVLRFSFQHNTAIEQIWTLIPAFILIIIAIPSCSLLYLSDEIATPIFSIKITGYQWYWNYNYSDFLALQFDSYITPEDQLNLGNFRLLEVDNALVLPVNLPIRLLITSADVIHSWALPSAGIKMDAIPGRVNQVALHLLRTGVFYGQCSELCGINHAFMPIKVCSLTLQKWTKWTYLMSFSGLSSFFKN